MNGEISNRNQNRFLYKAVNMFKSAVKSGILTWGSLTYYHWLTFGASLQWLCRELQFFGTGFIFRSRSLPLGWRSSMSCLFLHFHPYDQRLAQALKASKGGEERMNICCPFSSLCLLFIPSLLLCARPSVLCWLWHLYSFPYACTALLIVPICQTLHNSGNDTAHPLRKAYCICNRTPNACSNTITLTDIHMCACVLHIKRCSLLGWPLIGFDTHYQLSLMWN